MNYLYFINYLLLQYIKKYISYQNPYISYCIYNYLVFLVYLYYGIYNKKKLTKYNRGESI